MNEKLDLKEITEKGIFPTKVKNDVYGVRSASYGAANFLHGFISEYFLNNAPMSNEQRSKILHCLEKVSETVAKLGYNIEQTVETVRKYDEKLANFLTGVLQTDVKEGYRCARNAAKKTNFKKSSSDNERPFNGLNQQVAELIREVKLYNHQLGKSLAPLVTCIANLNMRGVYNTAENLLSPKISRGYYKKTH